MIGICDKCKRKPCPAEGEGLKYCDFYISDELKPCPFCGKPARIQTYTNERKAIVCGNVNCPCFMNGNLFDTEAEAVNAWNTRTERTCNNLANHQGCKEFVCSECGAHYLGFKFMYCPNCGAKVAG